MANNLMRFDPFRDLSRYDPLRDIDELFRDFSPTVFRSMETTPRLRMDVNETEQEYVVRAEIPGVNKEDIKVAINGNQVSLTAEVRQEKNEGEGGNLRSERYYGQLHRSFTLPQEVDDEQAQARYDNGVLQLNLPKRTGSGGKQLAVQ
ncbi:Hsp20/alpha crystallin family protein [Rugamonas sp. CCM 8940]|uniref:Hsp20/alpha crystallin family protein n=1 Tax=Rugamonas sp. CCM 8940 TaxID=2765359 RepID=UPI0018F3827C|nr:Hsp20/alpha crystallin family protein [Rugamonas sp. CCM 8940]MBJ7310797.1 Hsp20/alpha crystallin family protein [Rugamonas sp. CCM 8940]